MKHKVFGFVPWFQFYYYYRGCVRFCMFNCVFVYTFVYNFGNGYHFQIQTCSEAETILKWFKMTSWSHPILIMAIDLTVNFISWNQKSNYALNRQTSRSLRTSHLIKDKKFIRKVFSSKTQFESWQMRISGTHPIFNNTVLSKAHFQLF